MSASPDAEMSEPLDETVLVVYDSRGIRETIQLFDRLRCPGLVELDAPDEALAAVARVRPAVVFLCAMDASSRAYEICARLRAASDGALRPVFILSLGGETEASARALDAGADGTLEISMSAASLHARLECILQARCLALDLLARHGDGAGAALAQELSRARERIRELESRLGERP